MFIDFSSEPTYESIPVVDPEDSLSQSSLDYSYHVDHNMEGSTPSSPSALNQWNPPCSMSTSTPQFQFHTLPGESFMPWPPGPPPRESLYTSAIQFIHSESTPPYPDPFTLQTTMSSVDTQLSDMNYRDNLHGITNSEPSTRKIEEVIGNISEFPFVSSPLSYHDTKTVPPAPRGSAVSPGPHSRTQVDQVDQEHWSLPTQYPTLQTRGYRMHSYKSPSSANSPDFKKKNPEAMRATWIERYSRFVDPSKVSKFFSKRAKGKVATSNTIRASTIRRKVPARFHCPIEGCGGDFTRNHNLTNHLKAHCGVTDLICLLCGKGFTTIPVWKRHKKSCEKTTSSSKATPNGLRVSGAVLGQPPA